MAEENRNDLKEYFQTGDRPTQGQFADLIDSFVNIKDDDFVETLPDASISLKGIVEQATLTEVETGTDAQRFVTPEGAKRAVETFAPNATTTKKGIVEQATLTEVQSGIDDQRFVTPKGAKKAAETFAPVKSVNGFTGDVVINSSGDDSGWLIPTLIGGIINFSSSFYQVARYRKKNGVVYIEGLIKGGLGLGNVTVFNLPVGFRPSKRLVLSSSRPTVISRTDIYSNGNVVCYNYSSQYTSISGISFLVD